jgi:serine/threonine protein kinase
MVFGLCDSDMFKTVQFGKYHLIGRIAVGGMAELFKASLRGVSGFAKPMVVKQILPQYANDAEFVQMFINEAKTTVSLNHGNIVTVYELGRINHIYFIAMDYVPGKNIAEILDAAQEQNKPLSVEHAVYIAIEICKGLDYAHRRTDENGALIGIVHRDISPGNILVSYSGQVKITDFGIAKVLRRGSETQTGVIKGTYGYMSPQQIAAEPVDHRTDIFSTGVLLHEMLTGQRLFAGTNEFDTMQRAREADAPAPSVINPSVPQRLDAIVLKALAREPELRYYDASELQLELARFLYSGHAAATASSLSSYLADLFPAEANPARSPGEVALHAEEGVTLDLTRKTDAPPEAESEWDDEYTQSYAVRDELERSEEPSATAERDATRGYESIADAPGGEVSAEAAPVSAPHAPLSSQPNAPPKRPRVPDLAIDALRATVEPPQDPSQPHLEALADPLPRHDDAAAGADGLSGQPADLWTSAAAEPASGKSQPGEQTRIGDYVMPRRRGPRSDESVMALLVRPATDEQETVGEPDVAQLGGASLSGPAEGAPTSPPIDPAPPSASSTERPRPTAEIRPRGPVGTDLEGKSAFSATLSLFVQGLDEVEPLSQSASLDRVPHSIKPTVLGWIVIVALFCSSIAFVVYRRTALFAQAQSTDESLLDLDDIKPLDDEPETLKNGTIRLVVLPESALVLLHEGETPLEITGLNRDQDQLLHIERQGYRSKNQRVGTKQIDGAKALKVTLEPVGAGVEPNYPREVPNSGSNGQKGKVTVESDPPSATIWRVLGRGEALLRDVPVKRYYFKIINPGYEPSFVSVSVDQLRAGKGRVRESITLRPVDGAKAAPALPNALAKRSSSTDAGTSTTTEAKTADAGAATVAEPEPEQASEQRAQTKPTAAKAERRERRQQRASREQRRRRRALRARRKEKRREKKRRSNRPENLQMPSWAD